MTRADQLRGWSVVTHRMANLLWALHDATRQMLLVLNRPQHRPQRKMSDNSTPS